MLEFLTWLAIASGVLLAGSKLFEQVAIEERITDLILAFGKGAWYAWLVLWILLPAFGRLLNIWTTAACSVAR